MDPRIAKLPKTSAWREYSGITTIQPQMLKSGNGMDPAITSAKLVEKIPRANQKSIFTAKLMFLVRDGRIELPTTVWKTVVLPLN